MFDWKKPTVQMLGRWQPWHDGHQALFKRCVSKTGQVIIQVRDVAGASGGDGQDDNPFNWDDVCKNIETGLKRDNFLRAIVSIIGRKNPPKNIGIEEDHLTLEMMNKIKTIFMGTRKDIAIFIRKFIY